MKYSVLRLVAMLMAALTFLMLATACGGEEPADTKPAYVFKADGLTLWIGQPADGVVDDLPTVSSVLSSTSCGIPGTDYAYPCRGYRVSTTPGSAGDKDHYIKHIELTDDTLSTPEGVTIGSTREEVVSAMRSSGTPDGASGLKYVDGKTCLLFIFGADDCVTSIQYREN